MYRQPHLNEKAFAESLAVKNAKDKKNNSPTPADPNTTNLATNSNSTVKKIDINGRPRTPPADYDLSDLTVNDHPEKQTQQRAAIF